jgi:hypothetical protein
MNNVRLALGVVLSHRDPNARIQHETAGPLATIQHDEHPNIR